MKNLFQTPYTRIARIAAVATACCTLASCSDFLEVPLESTVATSNFYKTAEEFDMGLTGAYNMMLSAEWDDSVPTSRDSSSSGASEPTR